MSRIYVASSWRNPHQPGVVSRLLEWGHEVYDFRHPTSGTSGFQWSEIDPGWQDWTPLQYRQALQHRVALEGFDSDYQAMQWADTCVLVLPCGRSAHAEVGWMGGTGKRTLVLLNGATEPELMYLLFGEICVNMDELKRALE